MDQREVKFVYFDCAMNDSAGKLPLWRSVTCLACGRFLIESKLLQSAITAGKNRAPRKTLG